MSVSFHTSSPLSSESFSPSVYELELTYNQSVFTPNPSKKRPSQSTQCSSPQNKDQDAVCCICGTGVFLHPCGKSECFNKFHLHCVSYYFPELLKGKLICPTHSFKHLEDSSKLLHFSLNLNFSKILRDLLGSQKSLKKDSSLAGNAFWFGICQQYFPYFNLSKPTFFEPKASSLQTAEDSWVSQEIIKTSQDISKNHEDLQSVLKSIKVKSKDFSKNPKIGENLENSFRIPVHQSGKLIRKYEQTQVKSFKFKDEESFRDEEVCSVCDKAERKKSNELVICSNCSVAVHSKCYQVSQPESYWLCDLCKAHPMSVKSCSLCPVPRGALKMIGPNNWAHVTCARFLQKCYSNDKELDIRLIDKEKFKLKCFSCGIKTGACVQCCHGRCANAFHVECRKDLLETNGTESYWLCPSHKASKLTRLVKARQDGQMEFIKEIAGVLWNRSVGEKEHVKRKYNKKKNNDKKKIVIELKDEKIMVKVFTGNRLIRVMKYVEEGAKAEGTHDTEVKKMMPLKMKKIDSNYTVLENQKGDLGFMMRMPSECFEDRPVKKVNNFDFLF